MKHALRLVVVIALLAAAFPPLPAQADGPADFGIRAVQDALRARGIKAPIYVGTAGTGAPESFTITFKDGGAFVLAPDANGAMYGAFELAERIRRQGASALTGPSISGRPFLRDRGWNLFLTLPLGLQGQQHRLRSPGSRRSQPMVVRQRRILAQALRPDGPGPAQLDRPPRDLGHQRDGRAQPLRLFHPK